jgi:hypothetical protein
LANSRGNDGGVVAMYVVVAFDPGAYGKQAAAAISNTPASQRTRMSVAKVIAGSGLRSTRRTTLSPVSLHTLWCVAGGARQQRQQQAHRR